MTKLLDRQFPTYRVQGFGGGLNKGVNSFLLRDDELRDCKNVIFGLKGSIQVRNGIRRYDTSGDHLDGARRNPVRNIYRYNQTNGNRELVIQADQYIYADQGTQAFTEITTIDQSDDGITRFAQWRDTLFIMSQNNAFVTYHRGASQGDLITIRVSGGVTILPDDPFPYFGQDLTTLNGQLDTSLEYHYRFTFDYFHGDDFIVEGLPLDAGGLFFDTDANHGYHQVGGQPTNGGIQITKTNTDSSFSSSDARNINIYRTTGVAVTPEKSIPDASFFFQGSITMEAFNDASIGDVLFEDVGELREGQGTQINYNKLRYPARSKFALMHKNRMWYASIGLTPAQGHGGLLQGQIDADPYRIYFSEYLEPMSIRATSFFDIGPNDGEGITGIVSWKNRALFVFKENSIWGVFGGDIEGEPGIPDIQIEAIDEAVGCIATDSISRGEGGIMFLSNRGVMFFDGTRVTPINSKFIDPILDNVPAQRRPFSTGIYINKDRRYVLAVSDKTIDSTKNSVILDYDFFSNTWSRNVYGTTTVFGINKFTEAKRGDEIGKLYVAIENEGTSQNTNGAVHIIGDVFYEVNTGDGIPWDASTKFYDCGEPDIIKTFQYVIVRLKTVQDITVDYDVDEGVVTGNETITSTTGTSHLWDEDGLSWLGPDLEDPTHVWGAVIQGDSVVQLPQELIGRRISFKFSGSSTFPGKDTEIQGLTIVYTREKRIA